MLSNLIPLRGSVRREVNNRYTEKAKRVMHMACFIDPRFKRHFLDEPEAVKVDTDSCVQGALKLVATQVRE